MNFITQQIAAKKLVKRRSEQKHPGDDHDVVISLPSASPITNLQALSNGIKTNIFCLVLNFNGHTVVHSLTRV